MLAITLSDITIFGVIGIIIIAFVFIGLLKGFVRMSFGLVALAAGILASLWGFKNGASISGTLIENPDPWMSAAVGVILGLAIFFVARALFGVLLKPVRSKEGKARKIAPLGGMLGFVMGAAFVWYCLAGIRYNGTLSELDWVRTAVNNKEWISATTPEEQAAKRPSQPIFSKLKRGLDTSAVGQFHEKQLDFLNNRSQANLSKLTILRDHEQAWTRANLKKDVREATKQAKINSLLEQQNAKLKAFYEEGQYSQLLHSEFIKEACRSEEDQSRFAELDIEEAIGLIPAGKANE
ncbi:MAG: CvpA family protein [Roseibacillus sp.]|nr:CvpA family protein [Roseibacillus sp.]